MRGVVVLSGGGARLRTVGLVILAAVVGLGVCASMAHAGKGVVAVFGASGAGDGQFANAYGTAVNLASGDAYVVDQFGYRVERFDANGSFLGAFGWGVADGNAATETCTSNCQAGIPGSGDGQFDTPQGVAVDQADGSVYVVDGNNNRVEKFDASGTYQSQFGSAGNGDGQFSGPQGVAVDPSDGSVYVADTFDHRIEKFDNTGAFVSQFGSEGAGDGQFEAPTRVAIDSTGQIYVLDSGNGRIERFTSAGTFDQVIDPTDIFIPQEIAAGPGNDHLYVAQPAPDFSEHRVIEIDGATGALVDTHAVGSGANNASGLALNAASQKIYLADGFNARVFILDDVAPVDVTIDPPTGVTSTAASVSGTVNPNANPNVGWHFEISTDDASWSPTADDQDPGNGSSPVPVSQNLTGLVPNTIYFVRLVAKRTFNAPATSTAIQFTTVAIAPDASTGVADDVTPDHAVLQGLINPHNNPTTYYFEYGTTTAYSTSIPATQDADAGTANQIDSVLERVDDLQPSTTYHYRLIATNSTGTTQGTDHTFTTTTPLSASTPRTGIPGTGFLPDNRAYEKVSPNAKNGGDIMSDSARTHIASDGDAASFASLTGFGDVIGTGTATEYASVRNPSGWSAHAITPPQRPTSVDDILQSLQPRYVGSFSSDLSRAVFLSASPLTPDPSVANVANLYLREDVKSPGTGSYQLISSCPLCAATNTPLPALSSRLIGGGAAPFVAGVSADLEHVIFESQRPLTSDAPGGCSDLTDLNQCPGNLYEWDQGTVRLAGILPDTACGSPPCIPAQGSQAGQGAGSFQGLAELTPHTISADGSRILFTVPDFPSAQSGQLYMRLDHATTVQLNVSERTIPDPSGAQSAIYWDASSDGTRVFFTTTEALTDNSPADSNSKLYMYDTSRADSDPHNLTLLSVDTEPSDTAQALTVQGVSSNGHYVYFAAAGQLVAGQPLLDVGRALYVWHDGSVRYITSMQPPDVNDATNTGDWALNRPTARVTPDGLHLLFTSTAADTGPTGYDQGHCDNTSLGSGCRVFYVYSYASGSLACASCNSNGEPATASAFASFRLHTSGAGTTSAQSHPISDDGRHVFFSTTEALTAGDVNDSIDVYEYDVPTGTVHLITGGIDRSDSYFMNASASGDDAFFLTRQQLVGADKDDGYDMYDARVAGGFSEPAPPPPPCVGDACQTPESAAPLAAAPGSSLVATSGKPATRPKAKRRVIRCKKGSVRKKVRGKTRCVRKRKPHRAGKAKRSGTPRRTK